MNLLAHAFLSPLDKGILVGNIVADWVKGRARLTLPLELRTGIALHQRIDIFTDTHPIIEKCAALLEEKWGRYSTVLVDVFFDHLLAAQWSAYSNQSLPKFVSGLYETLYEYRAVLPERANYAISMMTADDWLGGYATLDGIRLALTRMSSRLRHEIELAPAVDDFYYLLPLFEKAFATFFPQLQTCVAKFHCEELYPI